MGALMLLARGGVARFTGAAGGGISRIFQRTAPALALGAGGAAAFDFFGGGGDGPVRRRRRKRVLTANDRADIAFIKATLGSPAGRDFAMIVAAR